MRNDCAASIEVREIHMDGETRRELDAGGAGRIAPLAIALAGRERAATLIKGPDMVAISGRMFCTWDLVVPASGDSMRVALLDTGRRVYAVTALVPENGKGATTGEVFPVQEDFLGGVRW